jgi:type IV pilus assembly protein PilA
MNRKGFTLVELLAVIAIVAVLSITVAPNIISTFNKSKKQNFITETREVCREASNTYLREAIITAQAKSYYKISNDTSHALDLSGRSEFKYYVKVNTDGEVIAILTYDGTNTILIVNSSGIEPNDISESDITLSVDTSNMTTTKAENLLR